MIAFTPEVYFALFEHYNLAIWPAQLIAYALGVLALVLAFSKSPLSSRIIGGVVVLFWLWNGLVYHALYFAQINFMAPVFAAFFVIEALLLAWFFVLRGDVELRVDRDLASWTGIALMIFAMAIFPLLGALAGHGWPQAAVFGVAPSPTLIYTLGILLLAQPRMPVLPAVIPILWALISWLLGIAEDISLPVAGIVTLVLFIRKNRRAS